MEWIKKCSPPQLTNESGELPQQGLEQSLDRPRFDAFRD